MIIYNITVKVETAVADDWLKWIKGPIARMMGSGCFEDHRICRLLRQDESDGITYAIQFSLSSPEAYNHYEKEWAPVFLEEFSEPFRGQYVAFRTLMEVLD